jgi:DNA-binding transcriptional LysR family regulator
MNTAIESFRLTVFRVVAERLSFTRAADMLHLTQPAVTSQIKALEEALGFRLFERTGGGVKLTPAGERLYAFAVDTNIRAQQALREIGILGGEQMGRFCLGASTTIAQYLLPGLLAQFLKLHPRIDLSVVSANTSDIVQQLLGRTIQIGLIEGPPGTSEIKVETFVEDEIVVIVNADHPFLARQDRPPTIGELSNEPLLFRESGSGTRRVVENALRKAGMGPRDIRIVMELDSTEAIKSGVEAGLGIGFVSRWALRATESRFFCVVPIRGLEIKRKFQFIYPHGPAPEEPVNGFLRFAREFRNQYTLPPR